MFCQPGEGLGAGERLPGNVCCRRSILQHGEVGIVLSRLTRVFTKAPDVEIRQPKAFNLRNINGRIYIDEVGRRTMSLVAHHRPVGVSPPGPLFREVL